MGRLALWGEAGSGKTHMLHAWCAQSGARLLPGAAVAGPLPGPLAIDDAQAAPERALLHLLNAAAEAGTPVLLAARAAPAHWPTGLADLRSRLRATAAVRLETPGDAMLEMLFASLLAARQLSVPPGVQRWLLLRLPRQPAALREVAARLDGLSLAAGRRVSPQIAALALAEFAELSPSEP